MAEVQDSQAKGLNAAAKVMKRMVGSLQQTARSVGRVALAVSSAEKAAAKSAKSAQKMKGQIRDIFSFDEINRISAVSAAKSSSGKRRKGSSGGSGGTQEAHEQLVWLEKLKLKVSELLKPLRQMWSSHSEETIASWSALYQAVKRFAQLVWGGLSWCYENVLKPLSVWTMEKGAPAALNRMTAGLSLLNNAMAAIGPVGGFLVERVFKPLAAELGGKVVEHLQTVTDKLQSLGVIFGKLGELTNSSDPGAVLASWKRSLGEAVKQLVASAPGWGKTLFLGMLGGMEQGGGTGTEVMRRLVGQLVQVGEKLLGERPMAVLVKLGSTAMQLWEKLKNGWSAQNPKVKVDAQLATSAGALWRRFREEWNTRTVTVVNSLKNSALSLWQSFQKKWASRSVTINNKLGKSARELWSDFKKGWSSKSLSLKVTYSSVQGVKQAVAKALGLSGWPNLSFAAKGGIVDAATLLGRTVVGEAGREAIVPLERNTQWANIVADQMAQRLEQRGGFGTQAQPIVVQVQLDGRVVGESTVQYLRGKARQGLFPLSGMI